MFENVLGQSVIRFLRDEIQKDCLPPALLFAGPEASGKCTTALEVARALSCAEAGNWTCTCESCKRHKELAASDILILGAKDNATEIRAAAHSFYTAQSLPTRYLFTRSVRKLTARFDPRLWDTDDARFLKAVPILADTDEALTDLINRYTEKEATDDQKQLEKQITKIADLCEKLQEECLYDALPVNQVRRASAWVRLMPTGKKKVLIIENADKMQESARNAFLKILEEPPEYAVFILTTTRRAAIMPTILSRVRSYVFAERARDYQQAVIERVFHDMQFCKDVPPDKSIRIVSYLQGFLPVSPVQFREAGALFWEYCFNRMMQDKNRYPAVLDETISSYRSLHPVSGAPTITAVLKTLNNCKPQRISPVFLESLLVFLQESLHSGTCKPLELEQYASFSLLIRKATESVEIFNSSPQSALETFAEEIIALV